MKTLSKKKFTSIYDLYAANELQEAARKVRALNRLELIQAMRQCHEFNHAFIGNRDAIYDWERFLENSIYDDGLL